MAMQVGVVMKCEPCKPLPSIGWEEVKVKAKICQLDEGTL